jgi:hypothetical protein
MTDRIDVRRDGFASGGGATYRPVHMLPPTTGVARRASRGGRICGSLFAGGARRTPVSPEHVGQVERLHLLGVGELVVVEPVGPQSLPQFYRRTAPVTAFQSSSSHRNYGLAKLDEWGKLLNC